MVETRKVLVVSHNLCAYPNLSAYSEPVKHSAVLRFVNRHEGHFGRYSRAYFYDVKGDRRCVLKTSWESIHSHTINFEDWERYNAKP
jgi:hypothetical protein